MAEDIIKIMKFKILAVSIILFTIFSGIMFSFAFAQEPIVNCELGNSGVPCDFCQGFEMVSRVINFLLYYAILPLTIVAFLAAGIIFLFSGDDPNKRTKGRKILWVTILGILIAFSGWLIVNTILDQLVNEDAGIVWMPWNEIPECALEEGVQPPPPEIMPECNDGADNDEDFLIDFREDGTGDPDCSSATDNSESEEVAPVPGPDGTYSAEEARAIFQTAGVEINRTNECRTQTERGCTSLNGIPRSTVSTIIDIKNRCDCDVMITGGTERGGHSANTRHGPGNPVVDLRFNRTMADYIRTNQERLGTTKICTAPIDSEYRLNCGTDEDVRHLHIEF